VTDPSCAVQAKQQSTTFEVSSLQEKILEILFAKWLLALGTFPVSVRNVHVDALPAKGMAAANEDTILCSLVALGAVQQS
jgi:hypothetical protein